VRKGAMRNDFTPSRGSGTGRALHAGDSNTEKGSMRGFLRTSVLAPTAWCLLAAAAPRVHAQRDTTTLRLTSVARSAVETYNAQATTRVTGAFDVPASRVIAGDVAVLNGPVTIAGRIEGSLVAINADVRFAPGASVTQQLIVVGGGVAGKDSAHIEGEIRQQPELLRYHITGDHLEAEREPQYDDSWWRRHNVRHDFRRGSAYTDFFFVASRAYNRVEGLSFVVGPRFQRFPSWGKINVEAFGVVRTAGPVKWGNETLGHDARAEAQFGKPVGVLVGARAFDVVEPTESWQMGNGEVGLSTVLLHRDFRDYYGRHGGEAYVRLQGGSDADLTVSLSDEQWGDRRDRDPWTLTRSDEVWRPNPQMDVGSMHLLTTRLRVDTRDGEGSLWSGWYLVGEVEEGAGHLVRLGSPISLIGAFAPLAPEPVNYARAFLDVRRYNRISPDAALNVRVALGGWLSGDPLPTQRRLALGGPGTLPGYAFREAGLSPDVLQCSNGFVQAGAPAQCARVALAQVELRSTFLSGWLRDDGPDDWWRPGFNHRMHWVLFADAGRGWQVGTADGQTTFARNELPPLGSFKIDLGAGVDFGDFGLYWAKAVRDAAEPVRFIVRLEHRF
jgi:hypothetical protein